MTLTNRTAILRSGAMGDLLQLTQAIRQYKINNPDEHITLFCGNSCAEIVKNSPHLSEIVTFNDQMLYKGNMLKALSESIKIAMKLRGYGKCFVMHTDKRWQVLPRIAGIPNIRTISDNNKLPKIKAYVQCMGLDSDYIPSYEFYPSDMEINTPASPYIAIAAGGARNSKKNDNPCRRWSGYKGLISEILNKTEHNIVLLGLKEDKVDIEDKRITDLCGLTSLSDVYHIIKSADLFIGNDSGLLHLACCTQTRKIGIFTATDPAVIIGSPDDFTAVCSPLPCSPCEDKGNFNSQCDNECAYSICIDEVMKLCLNQIETTKKIVKLSNISQDITDDMH